MHWTGIIFIDCWGQGWHQRSPKSAAFYQRILDFVSHRSLTFDIVIDAAYPIDGKFEPDPALYSVPYKLRRRDVLSWQKFRAEEFNHGHWLIAGQAWNQCIHQRMLGLLEYQSDDLIRCELYSHPELLDHAQHRDHAVTDQDLATDARVAWSARSQGYWRAEHPRYHPTPKV